MKTGLEGVAENVAADVSTAADNAVANGIIKAGEEAGTEGVVNAGALEDWSNVDFEARLAARDNAWESDNAINIHGNSINSPRTAYLYRLETKDGQFLKWGISQNPATRYSKIFLRNKDLEIVQSGARREILQVERNLVETQPGPLNFEPWAGARIGGQP